MEIKINIDESKFQEVLEKELGAFTQEELHNIMKRNTPIRKIQKNTV